MTAIRPNGGYMQRLIDRTALVLLLFPALACAACPIVSGRPLYASAALEPASFVHRALHRVNATMPVPLKTTVEVRIVASPAATGSYGSLTEFADWLGNVISGAFTTKANEWYGVNDLSVTANVDRNVYPAEAAARLRAEGFVLLPDDALALFGGKMPPGSVWVKQTVREMERRVVNAQIVASRARVTVEAARVCVDDRAGLIGFEGAVEVHDMGTAVHPDAKVFDAERQKRHGEFLAKARAEAARLKAWLSSYRHSVSPEQRSKMTARQPETFFVKIPFEFLGGRQELAVTVSALSAPAIDEALGR
jgi:hypothetical protein